MKPRADEFDLMVVRDGVWICHGTYQSRSDALEAAECVDRRGYTKVGIMPRVSYLKPFYTHPIEEC